MVKQLSVFLENTKGRLADMTGVLRDAKINLLALSIADTTNFGILRAIVSDDEKAAEVLHEAGYTVHMNEVIAAEVPDKTGGLADILASLVEGDVSVEYLYSFVRTPGEHALILFKVDNIDAAKKIFNDNNIKLLNKSELVEL
ncbi:MAG: ACT domain-containing protein [Eubacteriales bacterium]